MRRRVSQYMNKNPLCFNESEKVEVLVKIMKNKNITHAIITDEKEVIVGIISQKDMLDFLLGIVQESSGKKYSELELKNTPLKNLMTRTPVVVEEDEDMEVAIRLLNTHKFHCLPVVDSSHQPIGIITFFNLLLGLMDQMNPPIKGFKPSNHFTPNSWMNLH